MTEERDFLMTLEDERMNCVKNYFLSFTTNLLHEFLTPEVYNQIFNFYGPDAQKHLIVPNSCMQTDDLILVFAELSVSHLLPDLQRTFDT